ncbi:MAG: sugar transferase [Pseudomonadota bacterium]
MFREQHHIYKRLNNLLDAAITAASFVIAYRVRDSISTTQSFEYLGRLASFEYYSAIFIISCLLWPLLSNLNGLYPPHHGRRFVRDARVIFKSSVEGTVLLVAISYLFQVAEISRSLIIGFAIINFLFLIAKDGAIEGYLTLSRRRGKNLRHAIMVGPHNALTSLAHLISAHSELGLKVVGAICLAHDDRAAGDVGGIPILGELSGIRQVLHRHPADQVIFNVQRRTLPDVENAMFICEEEGVETWLATDFLELSLSHLAIEEINGLPFLVFRTAPPLNWQMVVKYFLDVFFAALFLVFLSPLFLIIALSIKLSSKGPVFYAQKRIGLRGRPFRLYKFRSMTDGSKVTMIGRFLRKSGMDELPQLFNILMGEMSFIGPRPHIPAEVELYAHGWQRRRLSMKPGLTCYRQIHSSGKVAFDMAMELDLKYIDNWSLAKDILIFFKTLPLIISRFLRKARTQAERDNV